MMDVRDGFVGAIGETPLIRLRRASEITGCEILGKAEFLNPGSSVKDRAALAIIQDAEQRGLAALWLKAPRGTPASVWRSWAMRADTARLSSFRKHKAEKRKNFYA